MNLEEEMMKMMGFSSLGKKKQSQKVDLIEKAKQRKEMLLNEKTNDEQDVGCKNKDFNSKDRRDVDYGRNAIVGTVSKDTKDTKDTNGDDDSVDGDDDDDSVDGTNDGVDGTNDGVDGIGYHKDSNDILDRFPEEDCFLCDHFKACTSFSLDKANSRLVTGARDHLVKLWDFNGMISTLKPFMSFEAAEGNLIRDVKFSNSGDSFIVAPSSWQPKLYDRDGKDVCTFSKGDPYIRDLKHVYGHTSGLTCIEWHPQKKHSFMTASLDSTVRIWDLENRSKSKSHFFIKGVKAGDRYGMNSATFSMDGRYIASSDCKGRVMVWSSENSTSKPIHVSMCINLACKWSCTRYCD
jgi:WD40 repeat protein